MRWDEENQKTFSCISSCYYSSHYTKQMSWHSDFRFRQILCVCLWTGVLESHLPSVSTATLAEAQEVWAVAGRGRCGTVASVSLALSLSLSAVCRCDAGLRAHWWTLQTRKRCIAGFLECLCWLPPETEREADIQRDFRQYFWLKQDQLETWFYHTANWLHGGKCEYQGCTSYFLYNNVEWMNPHKCWCSSLTKYECMWIFVRTFMDTAVSSSSH